MPGLLKKRAGLSAPPRALSA